MARQVAFEHGYWYRRPESAALEVFEFFKDDVLDKNSSAVYEQSPLEHDPRVVLASQSSREFSSWRMLTTTDDSTGMDFNDALLSSWHLVQESPVTMNIQKAWRMEYNGSGVNISIVDGGVLFSHPDLKQNYDSVRTYVHGSMDSWDSYDLSHGTNCAGIIAASANNSICSTGIAYGAKVSGIFLGSFNKQKTEMQLSKGLFHSRGKVQIYSNSWGVSDKMPGLNRPSYFTSSYLEYFATRVPYNKGTVFVWSSGNGGTLDDCNASGFINRCYTLTVGAVSNDGHVPIYGEHCAATLASVFSNSAIREDDGIVTTSTGLSCVNYFEGTSAGAAVASGVIALAYQANPSLSWRDVQHLVVMSANSTGIQAPDWNVNGVDRKVSYFVGYWLMDAAAMVTLAKNWTRVPELQLCQMAILPSSPHTSKDHSIIYTVDHMACIGQGLEPLHFIESVEPVLTMRVSNRGDVEIVVTSAVGTSSKFISRRSYDVSRHGVHRWHMKSTHFWGENANGLWKVQIASPSKVSLQVAFLDFYGTMKEPYPGARRRQEKGWARVKGRSGCPSP